MAMGGNAARLMLNVHLKYLPPNGKDEKIRDIYLNQKIQ